VATFNGRTSTVRFLAADLLPDSMTLRAARRRAPGLGVPGLVVTWMVLGGGCEAHRSGDFTIVALPDTQYYAADHPEILRAQSEWLVAHGTTSEVALVVHEGDIVDKDEPRQWAAASGSLHLLDGVVPYMVTSGNHDYTRTATVVTRSSLINRYFPAATFSAMPSFGGTFEPDHVENAFQLIDAPGGPWLILSLEFGPRDAVLAWANRIVKQHASTPTIVVTHAYLYSDDTRYDHLTRPDQLWNPHVYLDDRAPGSVNDGEEIWRKLIRDNDNILFVLCGHDLEDGVGRLTSTRRDGSQVHQLLANFQMEPLGGGGYLRVMRFSPAEHRVAVQTYSPLSDTFKTDPDNDFSLDY
jgi:hypothetical protein